MEAVFLVYIWGIWNNVINTVCIASIVLGVIVIIAFFISNRGFFGKEEDAEDICSYDMGEYLFAARARKYLLKPFLIALIIGMLLPSRDILVAMAAAPTAIELIKDAKDSNATKKLMVMPEKLIDLMSKTIDEKLKADQ